MKQESTQPKHIFSALKKINPFYILAFVPLLLIAYFSPFSVIIPFYGFLLLLLKSQKLNNLEKGNFIQKILGLIVIAGSFFVYYGAVLVYRGASFYSAANYVVYLFGLLLVFFRFSVLKETFTSLFLIVAATSSTFISVWLKPFFSPYTDEFAYIILNILNAIGVNARIYYLGNTPVLTFSSLSGMMVSGAFVYECIGVYSALVFSIILVVILFEDPSDSKVQLLWSAVGVLGTFALNIFRVTIIFVTDYLYGADVGGNVHYVIGYLLFSIWLVSFLYAYSKRRILQLKFQSLWRSLKRLSARASGVFT